MKGLFKWLGIILGGLIALVLIGVVAVLLLVDPNDYRDDISRAVKERTGRELRLEGDLELSFFPWLGVRTAGVSFSDDPAFGEQPMLQVAEAGVAIQVMPLLLRQQVRMDTLVLEGARIRLIRDQRGRANWEVLAEQLQARGEAKDGESRPGPEGPPEDTGGKPPLEALALGGVRIVDAQVLFEDRQAGTRIEAAPMNLTLGELKLGQRVPLQADWVVSGSELPRLVGELSAGLSLSEALSELRVQELQLDLNLSGEQIPGGELPLRVSGNPLYFIEEGRLSLPDLRVVMDELVLHAQVQAEQLQSDPRVSAALNVPAFNLRDLLQRLQIALETRDEQALRAVGLQAQLGWAGNTLSLRDLNLQLDETRATGQATVRRFAPLAANLRLDVDRINVDRYLPPPAEGESPKAATPGSAGAAAAEGLPLELLRELNIDGRVSIGEMIVSGLTTRNMVVQLRGNNGQIRLHPLSADLYEGRYEGDVRLDARGEALKVSLDEQLRGVQIGGLLQDLTGRSWLTGTANLNLAASTLGASVTQWLEQLDGRGAFSLNDGAIQGINVRQALRTAAARLQGKPAPAAADDNTVYEDLKGSMTIDGGVLRNNDFNAEISGAALAGGGSLRLSDQTLDYRLTVNLQEPIEGLEELQGQPIPLRLTGPITSPRLSVDLESVLKARVRQELDEETDKAKKKLEEKLREELGEEGAEELDNALRKLLRNRD
ncbi:AsmA family protein [Alkalilimnicola sp. S0819]|uniref:AsmA family protein n=1 Tax=Alkalilimnicola sp. S0819 TaxID=2613922 RepID=UPI001261921E|nr:AsmA family protein [Alkalilimnicola sp. S0819]KAB7623390.1 AsmA family protein [Alkalilimnicola sp. S0819]MPQ16933.1 AsmA family protein [Alkalilimnicola sp. S0819]